MRKRNRKGKRSICSMDDNQKDKVPCTLVGNWFRGSCGLMHTGASILTHQIFNWRYRWCVEQLYYIISWNQNQWLSYDAIFIRKLHPSRNDSAAKSKFKSIFLPRLLQNRHRFICENHYRANETYGNHYLLSLKYWMASSAVFAIPQANALLI